MRLSNGLRQLLSPILPLLDEQQDYALGHALRKVGKRGNGTYYPNDVKRIDVVLECVHDVTGRVFEETVENGDFEEAIDNLKWNVILEDCFIKTSII